MSVLEVRPAWLVFIDDHAYWWRCPCGKESARSWPRSMKDEAIQDAARHVQPPTDGESDEAILQKADWIRHERHMQKLNRVIEHIQREFGQGIHESMGHAAEAGCEKFRLRGQAHYPSTDVGLVFTYLENSDPDQDDVWDWKFR